jgi:hypothetical protein
VAQDWADFAVITGSAAGALTGLLFVAVSLNRERIAGHPALRGQAGQTLVLFMLPLLLSVLLVLPGWSAVALGTGLIVLAAVVLILVAGCLQCAGDDGLYWVAASSVLSLVSGVINAWLFLTRS